jgi:hypothetical protein
VQRGEHGERRVGRRIEAAGPDVPLQGTRPPLGLPPGDAAAQVASAQPAGALDEVQLTGAPAEITFGQRDGGPAAHRLAQQLADLVEQHHTTALPPCGEATSPPLAEQLAQLADPVGPEQAEEGGLADVVLCSVEVLDRASPTSVLAHTPWDGPGARDPIAVEDAGALGTAQQRDRTAEHPQLDDVAAAARALPPAEVVALAKQGQRAIAHHGGLSAGAHERAEVPRQLGSDIAALRAGDPRSEHERQHGARVLTALVL